ncbi:hypothetical protein E2C01_071127 [Portunus trituberculatus]|uniref:Uncharacterized protein n=1 Tax=Portunus trituberculatus TaxID=210409 RepID=A0A5B7HZ74_PORTR|nr:hypothetical protein [Portunus trituberculatus]
MIHLSHKHLIHLSTFLIEITTISSFSSTHPYKYSTPPCLSTFLHKDNNPLLPQTPHPSFHIPYQDHYHLFHMLPSLLSPFHVSPLSSNSPTSTSSTSPHSLSKSLPPLPLYPVFPLSSTKIIIHLSHFTTFLIQITTTSTPSSLQHQLATLDIRGKVRQGR